MKTPDSDSYKLSHPPGLHPPLASPSSRPQSALGLGLFLLFVVLSQASLLAADFTLGTTRLWEGPEASTNSVVLAVTPSTDSWTATANDPWLHLDTANQSGSGSRNVVFRIDANPGETRHGTLTVAGQTLAVTQAGSRFISANSIATLIAAPSPGQSSFWGVAVDDAGNVYFGESAYRGGFISTIQKWTASNGEVATLVSATNKLAYPRGLALDAAGNVYFADGYLDPEEPDDLATVIYKWSIDSQKLTTLVTDGLAEPRGVAVDAAGNVYFADAGTHVVARWNVVDGTVTPLVAQGLQGPRGVAVDASGNVYIADLGNRAIKKWTASNGEISTLVSEGLEQPAGVAVDGAGNVYFSDARNNDLKKWSAANSSVITLVTGSLRQPLGVAVDGLGNLYVVSFDSSTIQKQVRAFVDPTAKPEPADAGSDSWAGVLPSTRDLRGLFAPTLDPPWLTMTGMDDGVVRYDFTANTGFSRTGRIHLLGLDIPIVQAGPLTAALSTNHFVKTDSAGSESVALTLAPADAAWTARVNENWLHLDPNQDQGKGNGTVGFRYDANPGPPRTGTIEVAGQILTLTQYGPTALGFTTRVEGPAAGKDSVSLVAWGQDAAWTAVANNPWLHVDAHTAQGTGNATVVFAVDQNSGTTRTGSLTVAGQTLTITQAGTHYAANRRFFPLAPLVSNGAGNPGAIAVDGAGDVYIARSNTVYRVTGSDGNVASLFTLPSPASLILGLATDSSGNVFASTPDRVHLWTAHDNKVAILIDSGLSRAQGVAVDRTGTLFINDLVENAIKKWTSSDRTVSTLVYPITRNGGSFAQSSAIAADFAGNIYVANLFDQDIKKWTADSGSFGTLIAPSFVTGTFNQRTPIGVGVDTSGDVYFARSGSRDIYRWRASDGSLATIGTLEVPLGFWFSTWLAVGTSGDCYVSTGGSLSMLPRAFVDSTAMTAPSNAGGGALPAVLPTTTSLRGLLAPSSDQPWLTIDSVTDGVVKYSFQANPSTTPRTGNLTVLGATIPILQSGAVDYALGTTNLLVGPEMGIDSVTLAVRPSAEPWTATANVPWLHLDAGSQTGTASKLIVFNIDANPGLTRTGSLTVAGREVIVTQAGAGYVPSSSLTTVASGWPATNAIRGFAIPLGLAVDRSRDVYMFSLQGGIYKLSATENTITNFAIRGLNDGEPRGLAVDDAGSLYLADVDLNRIVKWTPGTEEVSTLISEGLNAPFAVALDRAGNLYIADTGNNAIKKWSVADGSVTTLVGDGLLAPRGVAVDDLGNVYIADTGHQAIKRWAVADGTVTVLVSEGLGGSRLLATDGSGNLFITDQRNDLIKKWTAATGTISTLVGGGPNGPEFSVLADPTGVAVDEEGSVYVSNSATDTVKVWQPAFVDPTPRTEAPDAGTGTLPVVLSAASIRRVPLTFASDQPWLTFRDVTDGVVRYAFSANTGPSRTAHITLLGTRIPVIQAGSFTAALGFNSLAVGGEAGGGQVPLNTSVPTGRWTSTANDPWLRLDPSHKIGEGSMAVAFTVDPNFGPPRTGSLLIAGQTLTITQASVDALIGTTNLLVGPTAGRDSVILAVRSAAGPVRVTAKDPWLHVDEANAQISASTNVVFTFDANPGETRKGTLSLGALTLSVTQAGSSYVAAHGVATVVSSMPNTPNHLAVDEQRNLFISDSQERIQKWSSAEATLTPLISGGLKSPSGLAVDRGGNLYIADSFNGAVKKWTAADETVSTLVTAGPLSAPLGVAVDSTGNVYFDWQAGYSIKKWAAADGVITSLVTNLVRRPRFTAVDAAGNVYFSTPPGDDVLRRQEIRKWTASDNSVATLATLVASPPKAVLINGVVVDGSGNLYLSINDSLSPAEGAKSTIQKWTAADGLMSTLVETSLNSALGLAMDPKGNLYFADPNNKAIHERQHAFVDSTPRTEVGEAGESVLPSVLPATADLAGPFEPTSDQPWLTVGGASKGIVKYSFTANTTGKPRTAKLTVLGQEILITQAIPTAPVLGRPVLDTDGSVRITFTGIPGASHSVWFRTSLAPLAGEWIPLGPAVVVASGQFEFRSLPTSVAPTGFYRVVSP